MQKGYKMGLKMEVKEQVTIANRLAGCLNDTIWRNKYIREETKRRIYRALVKPTMTYTA
jgi:hypothetical protein